MKASRQAEKFHTDRLREVCRLQASRTRYGRKQPLKAISKKAAGNRQANRSKAAAPEQSGKQASSK
jgi:hypothetical protein